MTTRLTSAVTITAFLTLLTTAWSLGSPSTIAIIASTNTVCGIPTGNSPQSIACTKISSNTSFSLSPTIPFNSLSGGRNFFCGLKSGGLNFFCWSSNLTMKRVYNGSTSLSDLSVGQNQIAAIQNNGIWFWRGDASFPATVNGTYRYLTSGREFTCAITNSDHNSSNNNSVRCWGKNGDFMQNSFVNESMLSIVAGDSHVCGVNTAGFLVCKGSNSSGQLDSPPSSAFEYSALALGVDHTCAVRQGKGTVVCWGGKFDGRDLLPLSNTSFELIVAGGNLTCGLTTVNFSVVCWSMDQAKLSVTNLPLPKILPGVCKSDASLCRCGIFPDSESLCSGSGVICKSCISPPPPIVQVPPPQMNTTKKTSKGWLAFAIIGGVGCFAGFCAIAYCIWVGVFRRKKVHNSVQPTIAASRNGGANNSAAANAMAILSSPFTSPSASKSRIFRRQSSRQIMRQRSGPSSIKDRAEQFSFDELAAATNNFALENKLGAGSFGTVYKGKLPYGLEVAIKRSESGLKTKKFQEKESAFQSELSFLSRLHHKHLVGLVGFCEENEDRLLVYEFMKNGALYDHLHSKSNQNSAVLNSWKMRIKVLLDASRGIEYLHTYAVPPIIHRDIKSSNILLDGNWIARVSDFGLSLLEPQNGSEHLQKTAAGTVGYMDPEYYGLHHLTVKSDVYGFGVVMLEVLTGKRAIFRDKGNSEGGGGDPVSVVDYAVPSILAGEVGRVLDERLEAPGVHEAEALERVAYTAEQCVRLEGRDRPTMTDIVSNLEIALAHCDYYSQGSMSSSVSLGSFD